ncbi:hypothetical protein [Chryseobacterium sp.]|nr:hypothetical protein [Chryseobacterium sp.]
MMIVKAAVPAATIKALFLQPLLYQSPSIPTSSSKAGLQAISIR